MFAWPLTRRNFLSRLNVAQVEAAIERAEHGTSGEIRICVAGLFWGRSRAMGERAFRRLNMSATRNRNGVLIVIAPMRRQLVIVGDEGLHARVGDAFWDALGARTADQLRSGDFTHALLQAVKLVGFQLAEHFPSDAPEDQNELPNAVVSV